MTKVLCFGDSITYGYMPGGAGRFDAGARYSGLLSGLLGSDWQVFEDGVCGRTTIFRGYFPAGIDEIAAAVRRCRAAAVVLQLGSNDCMSCYGAGAESIAGGMRELAAAAKEAQPGVRALFCAPPAIRVEALRAWNFMDETSISTAAKLPAAYKRAALESCCGFADANGAGPADPADGVHLNASGHLMLAQLLAAELKAMAACDK